MVKRFRRNGPRTNKDHDLHNHRTAPANETGWGRASDVAAGRRWVRDESKPYNPLYYDLRAKSPDGLLAQSEWLAQQQARSGQ